MKNLELLKEKFLSLSKNEIEKAKRKFRVEKGVPADDIVKPEGIETLKKPKLNLQNNGIFSIRANDPYDV